MCNVCDMAKTVTAAPDWTFGDRIRKARRLAGMTGATFAAALLITTSALGQYETDRSLPRDVVGLAKRAEDVTGVPAAWLLGLDDVEAEEELENVA